MVLDFLVASVVFDFLVVVVVVSGIVVAEVSISDDTISVSELFSVSPDSAFPQDTVPAHRHNARAKVSSFFMLVPHLIYFK